MRSNRTGGICGLSDGSVAGDWRLANVKELQSLLDYGHAFSALLADHLFTNVQNNHYWSSTTLASNSALAWLVSFSFGHVPNGQ